MKWGTAAGLTAALRQLKKTTPDGRTIEKKNERVRGSRVFHECEIWLEGAAIETD